MALGVLALQGDVREHVAAVESLGERVRMVRERRDIDGLAGLIIPGGESTTLSLLLESSGLFDPLADAFALGLPVFGTCAGMILLARTVLDGRDDQRKFGAIDLAIRRNGYGRQVASFECGLEVTGLGEEPVRAVFIRAPVVERAGPEVDVLATLSPVQSDPYQRDGGDHRGPVRPVVCRQGSVLTTAFHPELTGDRRLHQLFIEMTKEAR